MRISLIVLLLTTGLAANAQLSKEVSISIPATSLEAALQLLRHESHMPLAYEASRLEGIQVKARIYKGVSLQNILRELLQGTMLDFKQKGGNILIIPRLRTGKTVSGFIEDASSGEKLIGVSLIASHYEAGTVTNNYGFYSITVPGDSLYLQLSYTGYQRLDTALVLNKNTPVNFRLRADSSQLEKIIVTASRIARIQSSSQMSSISLPVAQVRSMPRLLGEPDLLKTLQLLPGVKQGTEGSSALLVRGGTPDQNLVLLDGAPLYNPMHLLGIFSTFNTSVLKDVTLYKGAFPARYGGRLSSVIDISTKDGNMHELHGDFSIGLLSTQLTLEGPLQKGKTSFVVSGRRSYPDLLFGPIAKRTKGGPEKFSLFFYDLNVKIHHQFSDKDKLYLSLYMGRDKLRILEKYRTTADPLVDDHSISDMDIRWGNLTGTLRWNHLFSPKLFANTMLIGSSYAFSTGFNSQDKFSGVINSNSLRLHSGIRDYGVKADFDYRPSTRHTVKWGASYIYRVFTPGTVRMRQTNGDALTLDSVNNNLNISATETDLYAEDDWEIARRLKLNAGLHLSSFNVQGQFYHSLQPRTSVRYLLPGDWAIKASYTRMTQYIHLLANNSISLPTDLWVPATKKIAPQRADQYALGVARNLFHNRYELSAEVYYKKMDNVIEYRDGADYLTSSKGDTWQEQIAAGTGEAYGAELLLQKKMGKLTGWLGYTWSVANRRIPGVNYGREFPYKYDRRHDLHLVSIYKLKKNVELSASWTYQSAAPFTIAVAQYEGTNEPVSPNVPSYPPSNMDYINSRNNIRVEPYHRLDLGISFIRQKKNGNVRIWNISVLNAYNRMNPFFYYVDSYSANSSNVVLTGTTLVSFIPSFSYSLKF